MTPRRPDAGAPASGRGEQRPLAGVDVLYELADDVGPVEAHVQAALQLPASATSGLAARVLWATRHVWDGRGARTAG